MLSNSNAFSPPSESKVSAEFIPASADPLQRVDTSHLRNEIDGRTGDPIYVEGLRYDFFDASGALDAPELLPAGGSRKFNISPSQTFEACFSARCVLELF